MSVRKIKSYLSLFLFFLFSVHLFGIKITKNLEFNKYTLPDDYKVNKKDKEVQWEKIAEKLKKVENFQNDHTNFGSLKNYKNRNGAPPTPKIETNVRRYQGIPLYTDTDLTKPERYAHDGSLVAILAEGEKFTRVKISSLDGEWIIPNRYVGKTRAVDFNKVVFVDVKNQNSISLEKTGDGEWEARSINPVTTGLEKPPYQLETPQGIFLVQSKKRQMWYLKDGSRTEIEGHAPFATRFSGGGYLHGIPVNLPREEPIEYGWYLGTTPRSHMCVRNATSHARFIYNWSDTGKTLIINFE